MYQIYEGFRQPINEVAQVSSTNYISEIIDIDGEKKTQIKHNFFSGGAKLELLPGPHTVTVVFSTHEVRTIDFTVEAGHSYILDRWGNNVVLIDEQYEETWSESQHKLYKGLNDVLIDKQIKAFVAPMPGSNDVIVRSLVRKADVRLVRIDGRFHPRIVSGFAHRLAPGQHTFELWCDITRGFFQADFTSAGTLEILGDLEPGCTYVIYIHFDSKSNTWTPILVKDKYHSVKSESKSETP